MDIPSTRYAMTPSRPTKWLRTLVLAVLAAGSAVAADKAPNGINLPPGYKDWRLISIDQRTDNHTLRAILGNDIAVNAARAGKTNPWPDGAILGKLVWKNTTHPKWEAVVVAGDFSNADFMIKERARYASTGGWGFARWLGDELKAYGTDKSFDQECFGCHSIVKDSDWVFTRPARIP